MNSTNRYLPLSLALVLVCSVYDARANSSLDPYAHVKAPQGVKKQSATIPSVDAITTPSTYVTMPMGDPQNTNKQGIVGTMMSTITAPHKSIKKASSSMVSGTKSAGANLVKGSKLIGDGFAKSACVIGQGIKSSSDKLVGGTQAVGSKIANSVPGGSRNTPHRQSISGMYEDRAAQELAKVDDKAPKDHIANLIKDSKESKSITRRSFMSLKNRPKVSTSPMPSSGFYEGAVASKAKKDHQKALGKVQPQTPATQAPKTIAAKPANAPSDKKWTNGFGLLKKPKLNKPTIGKGFFNKKAPTKQVAPTQIANSKDLAPSPSKATPAVAAKPPVTSNTSTTTQTPVNQAPVTHVSNMTQEKQGRFSKLTKIGKGLPKLKLNPFSKAKAPAPQTATKQAAPKKDLQL